MNKVSLQDIANRLGVSKGTVSLVLSGKAKKGRVSSKTILRVKDMAVEMNYFPNEIARSLTTGKTMTIGVIVTDISNEFFGKLAFYIQETAKKYGYTVITTNTNENLDEFEKAVTTLLNRRIDGLILVPVSGAEKIAKKILDSNLPMVQIDRYYPGLNASYIVVDNYHISAKATELLIKKGHKKIAVVCYDINLNALTERKRGCIDTLIQYDLLDTSLIKNINYENQEEEIKQAIIDIKNYKIKVDAIFFCSRRVFITGVEFMHKFKIIIPDEMDVLSFDRIDSFSIANIPFYFIEQPIKEMGEKAIDVLIKQIQGVTENKKYILDAEIKVVE